MSKTYGVDGMTCGGCANGLTKAIAKELPGASVSVDLEKGQVTVDPANDGAVERAVDAAGFTYRGVAA